MTASSVSIHNLPAIPRDKEGPVFREPWEAHAFALVVRLSEAGYFSWTEWASFLGQEIRAARDRGEPDLGADYYEHWLRALEKLCDQKALVAPDEMRWRKEQWRRAYLQTPHG